MATPSRSRWLSLGLAGLLVLAVALLVQASLGKRAAEARWNEFYELAMHPHAGMYVPVYEGVTTGGDTVRLGDVPAGHRQVLYFFTTSCPYCRASIPGWNTLAGLAGGREDVELVGVALDSVHLARAYQTEHGLAYPVVEMDDRRFARLFRVSGVPLTMIIESDGQVAYARRGEFSSLSALDSATTILDEPLPEALDGPSAIPKVRKSAPSGP